MIVACVVLGVPLASCSVPAEEEGGEVVAQQQQTFTEPQILENRYVWDDGTGMKSGMINVKVETLSVEQLAEIKASRGYNEPAEDFGKVSETPSDARNELIAWAAANPQATAKVILSLDEPVLYNWTAIRKAPVDSAARTSAIQAREAYTLSMLAGPTMSALQLGATNVNHYWIIPAMSFEIDTSVVSQLANWPAEWKVRLNKEILLEPNQYYTGIETRLGMIVKQFHVGGIFGQFGTRDPRGGPIRIGFFEAGQDLNWRHPGIGGWQLLNLGYYGNSRFGSYKRCTASACTTYQPSTVASHGTEVVGVALGTIEAGEDKQISNPTAREE
ncbi:MAG: hypothetical protein FWD57_17325, partial [Polyangiaceae bacterium]|nr:hypothetical protein [Polyangiaceae bacterium]